MNYSFAISGEGLSPITSVLPLAVPVRKEESFMARAMYHTQSKKTCFKN
jgi:hypothetical protein